MTALNQIIAIEKGVKSRVHATISELYKLVQKPVTFNGFFKHYEKLADDGEDLPAERLRVQHTVSDVLARFTSAMSELMDVTARKDFANCAARGDIIVDGGTITNDVPVTHLLFLEKQLTDFRTFVQALPTLDEAENWSVDTNREGLSKTESVATHRTKKLQRPIVLYDATEHHPAQTQLVPEDVLVGHWKLVKQSGAAPQLFKTVLLMRTERMLDSIKAAREQANMLTVPKDRDISKAIFTYLLG